FFPSSLPSAETACAVAQAAPHAIIARFAGNGENVLFDATWDVKCRSRLFDTIARREIVKARAGELVGITAKDFEADRFTSPQNSQVLGVEQSNYSMLFDNKFFMKLYC